MRRYRSGDEDSGRWAGFDFRSGDLVVSSRSKHGTTWVQVALALLVHRTPDLPAPLGELAPWVDWQGEPLEVVTARLEAQDHRRILKTHTPLDGLPLDARATYVVVARHPLDAAVSLHHQGANLDRGRIAELTGRAATGPDRPPLAAWVGSWIDAEPEPAEALDSLPGVLHHVGDAWDRRDDEHVVLVHYADLWDDLAGTMAGLADRLGLDPPTPELVAAARLDAMRERAERLAPDAGGVLVHRRAFFRRGGRVRDELPADLLDRYADRVAGRLPADLDAWLHRPP